jgi:maleylacetate reductase
MIEPFTYDPLPTRVIFGSGTLARLGPEVERIGARRALVLSTPGRAEAQANGIAASLDEQSAGG